MRFSARLAAAALVSLASLLSNPTMGQSAFPAKPVRILVPFGPGGAADTLPRLIGQKLTELWGQTVVVENRTGAAGNIGMEAGARATPDGYTLISAPVGNLAMNPHLFSKLSFDVFKDFTPITLVASVQNVLVVNPTIAATTVPELIALAKAKPDTLTFASGGSGTQAHVGGELFKTMAGIEMTHIAYKGVGDSVRDLLGGQVSMIFAQVPAVMPHIQSGKLRALGVANAKRIPVLPNVPTIAETPGLSGFEAVSWYALIGPAGLPREVVTKIQSDVAKVLHQPDVREKLLAIGADPVGSTPEQLLTAMRVDFDRYGSIIRKVGIKAD